MRSGCPTKQSAFFIFGPKKKQPLFPVALLTLIFWCRPITFLGIFRQALLKSGSLFYIDYVKKYIKKKKTKTLPTYPIFI